MNIDTYEDQKEALLKKRPEYKGILESWPFERLNKIHQLGFLSKTQKSDYKRSEHSIETCENAIAMLNALELNSAFLIKCNDWSWYRSAVEIAALLHDTGHGPYSHTWEHVNSHYKHEEMSKICVQNIFDNLSPVHDKLSTLIKNQGVDLIKDLIIGKNTNEKKYPGFLFEIVNNKQCEVDVDKWAYLKRDYKTFKETEKYQKLRNEFKDMTDEAIEGIDNVFLNARVSDDRRHIEYNYANWHSIYAIFVLRWKLHLHFYRDILVSTCDYVFARIVQRCPNQIRNKLLIDINANDEAFREFTDEKTMELIRADKYFKYVDDPKNIEYDKKDKKEISPLKGPGEHMPPDHSFYLYGNIEDKREIQRDEVVTPMYVYDLELE